MNTIKQKSDKDCGIACIAMIVGKKLTEVKKDAKKLNKKFSFCDPETYETWGAEIIRALDYYGFKCPCFYRGPKEWPLKKNAIVAINFKKKSGENTWHWVVYDKAKKVVRDPNKDVKNERIDFWNMKIHKFAYVY